MVLSKAVIIKYNNTYLIVGIDMGKWLPNFMSLNTHLKINFSGWNVYNNIIKQIDILVSKNQVLQYYTLKCHAYKNSWVRNLTIEIHEILIPTKINYP